MRLKILIFIILYTTYASFSFSQQRKIRLLFAGDAMQHKSQIDAASVSGNYDYSSYFQHIKGQIDSADIAIVNLEVTLGGKPYTGYPSFSAPDEFAEELKNAGFTVFLTANNHILDKGRNGLLRTIDRLDNMRVKHLGSYKDAEQRDLRYPMMLVKNGIRLALLNYTYDTNGRKAQAPNIVNYIRRDSILKDIYLAKRMNPDVIIANLHWGVEYKLMPSKDQTELANFLIENGVHIVSGSHPHVVQPIDLRKENDSIKNVIIYSLGNFVSGMKALNTDGGTMVEIEINKNEDTGKINIEGVDYTLVWVYKPVIDGRTQIQLIPVKKYADEDKEQNFMGEANHNKMMIFARKATETIEKFWEKDNSVQSVKKYKNQ